MNLNITGLKLDAKGEGTRGGKIIGHTSSGKPIYMNHNHPAHAEFRIKEHLEASEAHQVKAQKQVKASTGKVTGGVEVRSGSGLKQRGPSKSWISSGEGSQAHHTEQSNLHFGSAKKRKESLESKGIKVSDLSSSRNF